MRPSVCILPGFDVEAPFDQPFKDEEAAAAVGRTLDVLRRINMAFDSCQAERTYFLLGRFVEAAVALCGEEAVRSACAVSNPLVDIESHGYSHRQFRAIPIDPKKEPLTPDEVLTDIRRANAVILETLGKKPVGIRAPRGYAFGLGDDAELVAKVSESGMEYISSDLRDSNWRICTELVASGVLRQPRRYPGGLVEMPAHGWQDMAFSGLPIPGIPDFKSLSPRELSKYITEHYTRLIDHAWERAVETQSAIYIGLCLHPQAIYVYDRELELLRSVIDYAKKSKASISSYTGAYRMFGCMAIAPDSSEHLQ